MNQPFLIVLLLLLSGWAYASSDFEALNFEVRKEGNQPVVEWAAASEEGLHSYEVHVVTQYSGERIEKVEKKGAGYVYIYRDNELYKTLGELVRYEVHAVLQDGTRVLVGSDDVDYTPTAVRRTWGSIKAMFQ